MGTAVPHGTGDVGFEVGRGGGAPGVGSARGSAGRVVAGWITCAGYSVHGIY